MAIIVRGTSGIQASGPVKWSPNGWDLDRLTVPVKGNASALAAYIAGLTLWAASSVDGNMYLQDWRNDDDPVHPSVELNFIGKKGGTLPPAKNITGYSIQQAQFNLFPTADDPPLVFTIHLTYIAPTSSKVVWDRTAVDIGSIGAATPAAATVIWWVAHYENLTPSPLPDTGAHVLEYFVQKVSITGDSEEIVPGQYFRGIQTKQNLLFSVQA